VRGFIDSSDWLHGVKSNYNKQYNALI
jgi:hypothetical protein